MNELKENHSF